MNGVAATNDVSRAWKAVYTIVERPEKKYWVRIGTAFVNRDQSINVKLDASPTNGQLHIRDADNNYARRGEEDESLGRIGGAA